MAETFFPFDAGAGSAITESQWSIMARKWLTTGVLPGELNALQVYADSTGMQVKAKTGQAWLQGHFYQNDAEKILAIGAADPTNPRIDRVIVRVDWTANTVALAVLAGTPAANPTAPALTQNLGVKWEVSLAQVRVDAAVATITAAKVTDERVYSSAGNADTLGNYPPNTGSTPSTIPVRDVAGKIPGSITGSAAGVDADGANDTSIGNRTGDQATATAYSNTGKLTQIISWIFKRFKEILGTTNWLDAVPASLTTLWAKYHATTGHKHTGAANDGPKLDPATALTYEPVNVAGDTMTGLLVLSADPAAAKGAATKQYVDNHEVPLLQVICPDAIAAALGTDAPVYTEVSSYTAQFVNGPSAGTYYAIHDGAGTPKYHKQQITLTKRTTLMFEGSVSIKTPVDGAVSCRFNVKTGNAYANASVFCPQGSYKQAKANEWDMYTAHGVVTLEPGTYTIWAEFSPSVAMTGNVYGSVGSISTILLGKS